MIEFDNELELPGFSKEEVEEALEGLISKGLIEKTEDGKYRLTTFGKAVRDLKNKENNGEKILYN